MWVYVKSLPYFYIISQFSVNNANFLVNTRQNHTGFLAPAWCFCLSFLTSNTHICPLTCLSFSTQVTRKKDCKHEKNVLCYGHSCHPGFVKRLRQHPKQQCRHQRRQCPACRSRTCQRSERVWCQHISRGISHENRFQYAACSHLDYLIDSLCQYHQYWRSNFA